MTFEEYFGRKSEFIIAAPGRVEIGGNHTDHQGGCVFAGAVNLKCSAEVSKRNDKLVRIYSEGFDEYTVDLNHLEYVKAEEGSTQALIKGVAKKFEELDKEKLYGFDAYVVSAVSVGSGLSSSAAFEVLIGRIFNKLGNYNSSSVDIAQFAKYAENIYYGKPSGLMDQMACSVEGLSFMDFRDATHPKIQRIDFNLNKFGYKMCVVATGAGHEDLTSEYAAVTLEMKAVASCFGKELLSEVGEDEFYEQIQEIRIKTFDRAVLRAMHFFAETKRARYEFEALQQGNFEEFLRIVRESAKSSHEYLQNVIPAGSVEHQDLAFTLCLCEKLLGGSGAVRVHGGGFGGFVLAFVPNEKFTVFKKELEKTLGNGCVQLLEFC